MNARPYLPFIIAALVALPGTLIRLFGIEVGDPLMALASGTSIIGASFLLLWACDAVQEDVSETLALAVVALIAVLPEYAVDMYFTWAAGQNPASQYSQYAVANMTGANRLLTGAAWGIIAVLYWARFRQTVQVEQERKTELFFLGLATLYAFLIPLKGTLAWYDGLVFIGLYAWYIVIAGRRPCSESAIEGPAEVLVRLPKVTRRLATAGLFLFAAGAILANAEPFCEGLVGTGKALRINEFVLVQWLAPIASEAPEFVVSLVFAWRGQASMALGSLMSSTLNQWTLLVGMIPGVFAVSHGSFDHPIPMGRLQMLEILLTAAQSLLAVVLLSRLKLGLGGALLLFGLFAGQLVTPVIVKSFAHLPFGINAAYVHPAFSALCVVMAVILFAFRPRPVIRLFEGARPSARQGQTGRLPAEAKSNNPTERHD